ncbi:MAG: RtcB family protein [Anaerolineales bacterium]|nr:MAG: RtcB family protein [Anaerolineales bacterium]
MVSKKEFKRVEEYLWELPQDHRSDMRVPARIYADDALLEAALQDRSIEQLINTACLPGVVKYAVAMPDIHQGYGPPIGGVAAMDVKDGVISPGAVGYDINCGVRLLRSNIEADQLKPLMDELMASLYNQVPSGVGKGGDIRLSGRDMDNVLEKGAAWAVAEGYGTKDDLEHCEERGALAAAQVSAVSPKAKKRGSNQLGTLGAGNHFVEIGEVVEIYDQDTAEQFGMFLGQAVLWVHSGSRGLGHQVCSEYVRKLQSAVVKYGIRLPDRELVCAPVDSPEGREYMAAMASAANYAWANRQLLMHRARQVLQEVLAPRFKNISFELVYDIAHNIAKVEEFVINGSPTKVVVHRKGATRSFGPGNPVLPEDYREVGQPVLVPGDMGTASYLLVGTNEATEKSFASTCHGAGRVLSRRAATRKMRGEEVRRRLEAQGITVRGPWKGLAEEAPHAYKDIDRVVNVVHKAGLARKVARMVPLGVMKG